MTDLAKAIERVRDFATLLPLLSRVTVREVIEAGDPYIDAAGLNPYCMREGLADGSEQAVGNWKLDPQYLNTVCDAAERASRVSDESLMETMNQCESSQYGSVDISDAATAVMALLRGEG